MSGLTEKEIPRHIDDMVQLLWWEADEVAVIIGLIGFGIVMECLNYCLMAIPFISKAMTRYKFAALPGSILHAAYWAGWSEVNKHLNNGLKREYWL